jgi:hypothetical protein
LGCKARGNFTLNERPRKVVLTHPHNHPQDYNDEVALRFMKRLKMVCTSGVNLPLKTIYQDIAKTYPEGANLKPYCSVRSSMARWKMAEA